VKLGSAHEPLSAGYQESKQLESSIDLFYFAIDQLCEVGVIPRWKTSKQSLTEAD
jgi:hypothetical protein